MTQPKARRPFLSVASTPVGPKSTHTTRSGNTTPRVMVLSGRAGKASSLGRALTRRALRVALVTTLEDALTQVAQTDAVVVDVGPANDALALEWVNWSLDLRRFRAEQPLAVIGDGVDEGARQALIDHDVAGLFPDAVNAQLVAAWTHSVVGAMNPWRSTPTELNLDRGSRIVSVGERLVILSPREYEVLEVLLASRGQLVTREVLLQHIWGDEFAAEVRTIDAIVSRLRRRLRQAFGIRDVIRTISHRGYIANDPAVSLDGTTLVQESEARATCWAITSNQGGWLNLLEQLGAHAPELRWLQGRTATPAPHDLVLVVADSQLGWLSKWRDITRQLPGCQGLLLPAGAPLKDLLTAVDGGQLKPVSNGWLATDLPAWLRWHQRREQSIRRVITPRLQLMPSELMVRVRGMPVKLPRKDFEVLEVLHRFAGRVVGRDQLRQLVWQGDLTRESRSLDIRISNLRRIFRRFGDQGPPSIETITSIGYRLKV